MALVDSLLTAIVRADGDALVMHVGERPYVVASSGPIELSAHGLNLEAMSGMLGQLLPADTLRALREFGAIEHELDAVPAMGGDRFTVVAARGGDDIWIEVRRHRRMKPASGIHRAPAAASPAPPPAEPAAQAPPVVPAPAVQAPPVAASTAPVVPSTPIAPAPVVAAAAPPAEAARPAGPIEREPVVTAPERVVVAAPAPAPEPVVVAAPEPVAPAAADPMTEPMAAPPARSPIEADIAEMLDASAIEFELVDPDASDDAPPVVEPPVPVADVAPLPVARLDAPPLDVAPEPASPQPVAPHAPVAESAVADVTPPTPIQMADAAPASPAVVVDDTPAPVAAQVVPLRPVPRQDGRHDGPARSLARHDGLERLLRLAVARGASALYLTTQAPPALRADGEVQMLAGEPPLTSEDVEAAILEILPDGVSEAASRGEATEWIRDLPDIGRVRCTTFRDYRGPGALLRMISARAASAEQLGLSREIQALATETEGLVLISGPRGSGKSTLVAAVVDLINRQRADYVVTLERQIRLVHESRHSLISQREVRGHGEEVAAAARAALRENPDVLVIEDLRSPETLQVALDAAGSGLLVVMSVTASATTAALERLVDMVPADRRAPVQAALAETLRGAMSQVLLRKATGGRVAARELLLSTAAVARLLAEGQLSQVPRALDGGRKHGMTPLNDTLVSLVQGGVVDVREAYRKAADREGLLAQLKRAGLDTSFVERLA